MKKFNIKKMTAFLVMFSIIASCIPQTVTAAGKDSGSEEASSVSYTQNADGTTSITYGPGLYTLNDDGTLSTVYDEQTIQDYIDSFEAEPFYTKEADGSDFTDLQEYTDTHDETPVFDGNISLFTALGTSTGKKTLGTVIQSAAYTGTVTMAGYYYMSTNSTDSVHNTFIFNGVDITCNGSAYDCAMEVYTTGDAYLTFSGKSKITKKGYTGNTASAIKCSRGKVVIAVGGVNDDGTLASLTIDVSGAKNNYAVYQASNATATLRLESARNQIITKQSSNVRYFYDANIYDISLGTEKTYADSDKLDIAGEKKIILPVGETINLTGEILLFDWGNEYDLNGYRYINWGNDGITYKSSNTSRATTASDGYNGSVTGVSPGSITVTNSPNAQNPQSAVISKPIDFVVGEALAPTELSVQRVDKTTAYLEWSGAFVDYGEGDSEIITGYEIYYSQENITDDNIDDPDVVTKIEIEPQQPGLATQGQGNYTFEDLEEDGHYFFRIKTKSRIFGTSKISAEKSVHLYIDPIAPDTMTAARVDDKTMDVTWSGAGGTNVIGYRVYYNVEEEPTSESPYREIFLKSEKDRLEAEAKVAGKTFDPGDREYYDEEWEEGSGALTIIDSGITPQRTYYIKVQTISRPLEEELYSPLSDVSASVYMYKSPEPPFTITADREDDTTALVKWGEAAGDSIFGYRIYYFLDPDLEIPFDTPLAFFNNINAVKKDSDITPSSVSVAKIKYENEEKPAASDIYLLSTELFASVLNSQKDPDMEKLLKEQEQEEEVDRSEFIDISFYKGAYNHVDGNMDVAGNISLLSAIDEDTDVKNGRLTGELPTNTYTTAYTGEWTSTSGNYMKLMTAGNYYFNGVTISGIGGNYYGTILFRNKGIANLHFYGNNTISRSAFTGAKASAIYVTGGATVNIYNYGTLTLVSSGQYSIYNNEGTVNLVANRVTSSQDYYGTVNDNTTAPPTAPTVITAEKTTATSATVSWENGDGGSYNIYGYRIYYSKAGDKFNDEDGNPTTDSDYVSVKMLEHTSGSYTIEGLMPQETYKFKIVTVTPQASSYISDAVGSASLKVVAGAPTEIVAAKASATTVNIEWSGATLDEGDGRILQYNIYYDTKEPTESSSVMRVTSKNSTSGSATVTGLSANTVYYFKISTVSSYHTSDLSEATASADTTVSIQPPSVVEVTREDTNAIRVDWRDPYLEEGVINKYVIYYDTKEPTTKSPNIEINTSATSAMAIIEGLSLSKYYVKIKMFSTYRDSELSETANVDLSLDVFAPKTITVQRIDENSATVTWSNASGSNITGYQIYYDTDIPTKSSPHVTVAADSASPESGSTILSSMASGQINYIRIATIAAGGTSTLSSNYGSVFLYKGISMVPGETTTLLDGNTYVIDFDGEYTLAAGDFENTAIKIADNVTAEITVDGDLSLDNSGNSEYEHSAISVGSGAKLTLYVTGNLTLYGSPAGDGTTNIADGQGGIRGYAGIEVPSDATLVLNGTGVINAYGGDAGDGGNSIRDNSIGGSGGGGAGAGIGGNGGKGGDANTLDNPDVAGDGENGSDAGYIHIVGELTVNAYGGSGGSGGYIINGDAGGGGGYPAAGIGGGGAGGGGATTMYGGGGFSGGSGEETTVSGEGSTSSSNGNGSSHQYAGSGYYTGNTIGGAGKNGAGTGGTGGAGGTVFADTTYCIVNAYNGNYITALASGSNGNDWGENPAAIYAQMGYDINSVRDNQFSNRTTSELKKDLKNITTKTFVTNNVDGIGAGAGYTEQKNGVYAPYIFDVNYRTYGERELTNLASMNIWYFRAQTASDNGLSTVSDAMAEAYMFTMPLPPTELGATWESPTSARLYWDGARGAGIDRYYIYYTTEPNERVERWSVSNEIPVTDGTEKPSEVSIDDIFAGDDFIILYNASKGQQYKIFEANGDDARQQIWREPSTDKGAIEFKNLTPETKYILATRYMSTDEHAGSERTEGVSFYTRPAVARTVEPEEGEELTEEQLAVEEEWSRKSTIERFKRFGPAEVSESAIKTTDTTVTITPSYYGSAYMITDASGKPIAQSGTYLGNIFAGNWLYPENNKVVFTNLTANTEYRIVTKYRAMYGQSDSAISESITVTTQEEGTGDSDDPDDPDDPDNPNSGKPSASSVSVDAISVTSTGGEAVIKGLSPQTTYYFKIASGSSHQDRSAVSDVTAQTYLYNVPDKPYVDKLYPRDNGILVHHIRTSDNNGSKIQYYEIYLSVDDVIVDTIRIDADEEDEFKLNNILIDKLDNGKNYTVTVAAHNSAGFSAPSNPLSVIAGSPCAPDPFRVHSGEDRSLNARFYPSDDNNSRVRYYNLYIDGEFYTKIPYDFDIEKANTYYNYEYVGRYYGDTHVFEVSGVNARGEGPKTEAISRSIGAPSTAQVSDIVYYADGSDYEEDSTDPTGIDVSWDPANGNGEVIRSYHIYLSEWGEDEEVAFEVDVDPDTKIIETEVHIPAFDIRGDGSKITYLKYGQAYNIEIEAESIAGVGSRSEPYKFIYGAPSAPIITMAHGSDEIITTTFISTEGNGADVLYFNLYVDGNLVKEHIQSPQVIDKLANGITYKLEVTAVNRYGESARSKPVAAVPGRQPSEPKNVQASPLSGTSVSLSWQPPVNNGGYDILTYYIAGYKVGDTTGDGDNSEDQDASKYITCDVEINGDNTAIVSGLENGTNYQFEVFAITANYSGYIGKSNEVATFNVPDAPTITKLLSTAERIANPPITIWWDAPEEDGGAEVEAYNIYLYDETTRTYSKINATPIYDTAYTFTHEKMTRRNTYQLAVTAINSVGESDKSERKSLLMGAPYAPENLAATTEGNTVHLSWTMPDLDTCYVEGYRVYLSDDMERARTRINNPNQMSVDLEGMELGKTITLYVKSFNDVGSSPFSKPLSLTIGTADPPVITSAIIDYEQVTLNWQPPSEDSSIKGYVLYEEHDGNKTKIDEDSVTRNAENTQAVITGLTGGTKYTFTITSYCEVINTSVVGDTIMAESVESEAVSATPWTKPEIPLIDQYSILSGDKEFSFKFEDSKLYGLEVDHYNVYLDGSETPLADDSYEVNGNTITVKNVTNGLQAGKNYGHRFYMTTVTKHQRDDSITYESDHLPEAEWFEVTTGLPQAPVIETVTPSDQELTVYYHVPNEDKIEIVHYEIVYSINDNETTITTPGKYCEIKNLENGVPVQIKVRARSLDGYGPYSDWYEAIPGTAKAPELEAIGGDALVKLSWNVPESPVSPIYKYNIYIDGNLAYESNITSLTVTNLTNGVPYKFSVAAVNEQGPGEMSEAITITPGKVPGEVESAVLTALSDTEVSIEWKPPMDNGGRDVTGYKVTCVEVPDANITVNWKERTATVTGLDRGKWYSFEIIAINETGDGLPYETDSVRTMVEPSAPSMEKVSSVNNTISARWIVPADEGGTPITGYNVYANGVQVNNVPVTSTSFTFGSTDKLTVSSGSEYSITVAAINAIGEGVQSAPLYVTAVGYLTPTAPGRPRNLTAIPGDSRVTLEWVNPAYDGNDEITEYLVYAGSSEDAVAYRGTVDGETYSFVVPNLNNGSVYVFAVKAKNSIGESEFSDFISASPAKLILPMSPTGLQYSNDAKMENMTISWNAVDGDDITYKIYIDGELVETTDGTSYTMPVGSGKKYIIQIGAVNSVGETASQYIYACNDLNVDDGEGGLLYIDANYDGEIDEKIEYSIPSAPDDVAYVYDPATQSVKITWTEPFDGNNAIIGYAAYVNGNGDLQYEVDSDGNPTDTTGTITRDEDGKYTLIYPITFDTAYTIQIAAINGYGVGDKSNAMLVYVSPTEYPTDVKAWQEDNDTNPEDVTIDWQMPDNLTDFAGFALYINGTERIIYELTPANPDGYVYDSETRRCTYHYTNAEVGTSYLFRVATLFTDNTTSRVSNAARLTVEQHKPNPPEWDEEEPLTADLVYSDDGSTLEKATVTLKWTKPDTNVTSYTLYLNGDVVDIIEDIPTETPHYTLDLELGKYYIFRVTAMNDTAESDKSEKIEYSTIIRNNAPLYAPLRPDNVQVELVYSNNNSSILAAKDNMLITWEEPERDVTRLETTAYQVYINDKAVSGGLIPVSDGVVNDEGKTVYSFTATVTAPQEYGVYIKAVAIVDNGEGGTETVVGDPTDTVFITTPYVAVETPELKGEYDAENNQIMLEWSAIDNADYYVLYTPNAPLIDGTEHIQQIYGTSYSLSAQADKDYEYRVTAVNRGADYESEKSNICYISTYDNSSIPKTLAGAPEIVRSISDYNSKVTIYWTPPEENNENIYGYYIIRAGERVKDENGDDLVVLASDMTRYGEYKFTFEDVPEETSIPVAVLGFEVFKDQVFVGNYSNIWNINLELNISDEFGNDDPSIFDNVQRKDADGDGLVDEIGITATLSGVVDAGGAIATITVRDRYGSRVASIVARSNFRIDVPLSLDSSERYQLEISRTNYTKYTITDMDLNDTDVRNTYFKDLKIYAGDVNADDYIGLDDLAIVNNNYSQETTTGDVNSDGRVNVDDLALINMNYSKRSVTKNIDNYKQSISD